MNWQSRLSKSSGAASRSDVIAILKLAERPEVISFAGGLPDPNTYLLDDISRVAQEVLASHGRQALGYCPIPGISPLREWLAEQMSARGRPTEASEILITTGGIAALDLIARALLDPGDTVVVGEPSYLAALHVFRSYRARFCGVAVDRHGMVPDALELQLARLIRTGVRPKLIYLVPSFQNPSSATLPEVRRRRLVEIAAGFDIPVVADEAYRDLRFEGDDQPLMSSLDGRRVIHINTCSKVFNPGVRLGWIAAPSELIDTLCSAKIGQDQCSSTLGQFVYHAFATQGLAAQQVSRAIEVYTRRRDLTLAALDAHMPDGVTWSRPEGGFYIWLTLPERADTDVLTERAITEHNVAYVAGSAFYHNHKGQRHLRLSYSFVDTADIDRGIERLARLIRNTMETS